MRFFFYSPADDRKSGPVGQPSSDDSSIDYSCYQPIDPFSDPPLDHPYFGYPYTGHKIFSNTLVPSNDTLRCFPPAPTGLPADIGPGSRTSLGDPGLLNPFRGVDQVNLRSGSAQSNDCNDMAEVPFLGGAHVDSEARLTTSSALPSVPVGKPDEADDKITVADIDRLLGINYDRVCTCLNCLDYSASLHSYEFRARFSALEHVLCRIEGCTWNKEIGEGMGTLSLAILCTRFHEEIHFRERTRDQNEKRIYTCTNDRCRIRTKRKDDVKRHYATVHCKNPQRFPCHVIGCPFGGENGFTRKDKLTHHMKSTHKGLPFPGKRLQAIKPKMGVSNAGVHEARSQA